MSRNCGPFDGSSLVLPRVLTFVDGSASSAFRRNVGACGMNLPVLSRTRSLTCLAVFSATVIFLAAFTSAPQAGGEPPQDEEIYRGFDLATVGDLREVRVAGEAGDVAAQYALSIIALYGLGGQPVDLAASSTWLETARLSGQQTTVAVTQFIPADGRHPARMRNGEMATSVAVEAYQDAAERCMLEAEGHRPNSEACGSNPEDRARRRAAWLAAAKPPGPAAR